MICQGLHNNSKKSVSYKDSLQITISAWEYISQYEVVTNSEQVKGSVENITYGNLIRFVSTVGVYICGVLGSSQSSHSLVWRLAEPGESVQGLSGDFAKEMYQCWGWEEGDSGGGAVSGSEALG